MKTTAERKGTWRSCLFLLHLALSVKMLLFQVMKLTERTEKLAQFHLSRQSLNIQTHHCKEDYREAWEKAMERQTVVNIYILPCMFNLLRSILKGEKSVFSLNNLLCQAGMTSCPPHSSTQGLPRSLHRVIQHEGLWTYLAWHVNFVLPGHRPMSWRRCSPWQCWESNQKRRVGVTAVPWATLAWQMSLRCS